MGFTIDADENKWSEKVLNTLLLDRTTGRNIIWATSDYESFGSEYNQYYPILIGQITGINSNVIKPRVLKSRENQGKRTKKRAEVFTPSWVCNVQNNLVDKAWFGRENIFNIEKEKEWIEIKDKIAFPNDKNKTWQKYVDERRLEITCGEAPYLVSRYDAVSGNPIDINKRIGLLDRKLRVVKENTNNEEEWLKWSERAFKSIYGFEFQGDNLLIARENLLLTYCEYMEDKLNREPTEKELINIAKIISWNLWQMDGLVFTVPFGKVEVQNYQMTLYDFLDKKEESKEEKQVFCIIKDWLANKTVLFKDLVNKG